MGLYKTYSYISERIQKLGRRIDQLDEMNNDEYSCRVINECHWELEEIVTSLDEMRVALYQIDSWIEFDRNDTPQTMLNKMEKRHA